LKRIKLLFLFGAIFVSMSFVCYAADLSPQGFLYSAPVTTGNGQTYTSVRLTPEIINESQSDLSDLLLMSDGQPLPYFINGYSVSQSESITEYRMVLSDSYEKDSFQYLDYKLQEEPADDIIATSLHMTATGQFAKEISLYGSYDGLHWDFVRDDSIHQVDGSRKLSVELLPKEKYTWYRFRISGNQEPVTFDRVWLEYRVDVASKNFFVETLSPGMAVEQDEKATVVILSGLKNLELSEIELKTDSMFKRNVYINGSPHVLYNLTFGSKSYRDLTIRLNGYQCRSDQLEIRIENGDDTPIQLDSISVSYLAYDIIFQNTQNPITLYFGNVEIARPPQYDIAGYRENILAEGYGSSAIGEIIELPAEPSKNTDAPDYTMVFNIVIVLVAVLLAVILIIRLKKVK